MSLGKIIARNCQGSFLQAKLDAINNQTVWVTTVRLWYVLREYSHCHQKRREVAVPCSFHSDGFINQGINHRDGNEGEFRALTMFDWQTGGMTDWSIEWMKECMNESLKMSSVRQCFPLGIKIIVSEMCFKLTLSRVFGDYNYGWVIANFKPGAFGRYSCRILMCSASAKCPNFSFFCLGWRARGGSILHPKKRARANPKQKKCSNLFWQGNPLSKCLVYVPILFEHSPKQTRHFNQLQLRMLEDLLVRNPIVSYCIHVKFLEVSVNFAWILWKTIFRKPGLLRIHWIIPIAERIGRNKFAEPVLVFFPKVYPPKNGNAWISIIHGCLIMYYIY